MHLYRFDASKFTRWGRPGFCRNPGTNRIGGIHWATGRTSYWLLW
jgi:hypothetical protein